MSKPHEFVRDEHNLRFAPAWLVYVLAVAIIVMVVAFVLAVCKFISGNYVVSGIWCGIGVILAIFGRICDHLEWHRNVKYSFEDDKFIYSYDLDKDVLPTGNPKVKFEISNIMSIKSHGNVIVVAGDIIKHAPMGQVKTLTKAKLSDIPGQHEALIYFMSYYKTGNLRRMK